MDAAAAVLAKYGDLPFRGRPIHNGDLFSRRHPPMQNRAKIFAPFAALVGFDECIKGKDIQYESKRDADERRLNQQLNRLHSLTWNSKVARENRVSVTVEYYVPCTDPHHDAYGRKGQYRTMSGTVQRVDQIAQVLVVDGQSIPFSDIYRLQSPALSKAHPQL